MSISRRRAIVLSAVLLAAACTTGSAAAAPDGPASSAAAVKPKVPATRIGVMVTGVKKLPARIRTAKSLGATLVRPGAEPVGQLQASKAIVNHHFAGLDLFLTITYRPLGAGHPSSPPADLAAYAKAMGQTIDATEPTVVAVENEELAPKAYAGTPAQYLAQLNAAAKVAHQRKVKITNGGIVVSGVVLATWHDLWKQGRRKVADDYLRKALPALRVDRAALTADLPSAAAPTRPILASNPKLAATLKATEACLAGFRKSPIDYVNFHWYQAGAKPLGQSIRFLEKATGKRAVTNDIGQYDVSPSTLMALLGEVRARHLPYVVWHGGDGGAIKGLYEKTGVLRPNGVAFREYLRKHPA